MNAMNMAKTAYSTTQAPIRTPRSVEYEAFARITRQMKLAAEKGRFGFADLTRAVHENRRLWTLLAADVAGQENALSPELRAKIFYLAEFTNQHSSKVLKDPSQAPVLIEINTAIMRGLRQRAEAA